MTQFDRAPLALALIVVFAAACSGGAPRSTATARDTNLAALTAPAGTMVSGHVRGSAARLADGRVIVTGGEYPSARKVDVYDPTTGSWSAGPDLPGDRSDHQTFALPGGGAVVAGGTGDGVDLYDPATNAWTHYAAGGRQYSAAALLADGRVLIASGYDDSTGSLTTSALLFDPVQHSLVSTGALGLGRSAHTMVALADGRALVVGGWNGGPLTSVETYDPQTAKFTAAAPLLSERAHATATLLADGRVLVAGGAVAGSAGLATAEVYSPATNAWTEVGSMHHPHSLHEAIRLPGGGVAIFGETGIGTPATADVDLFDPTTGTFSLAAPMSLPRYYEASALLLTGQVLVASGLVPGQSEGLTSAEILSFGACAPMTCTAVGKTCGTMLDGCGGTLTCGPACSACTPTTCAAQGKTCGSIEDGCGGVLECGTCPSGTACSGDGVCVAPSATYDPVRHAPSCNFVTSTCSSGTLLLGRAGVGPEANAPNTIDGCADGAYGAFHADESLDALRISTVGGEALAPGNAVHVEADVWAYAAYTSDALDLYVAADADAPAWSLLATLVPSGAGAQVLSTTAVLPSGGATQAIRGVFRYGGAASPCSGGGYDDHDDLLFTVAGAIPPPDTTPPTVSLLWNGALFVTGTVSLEATASDDRAVTRVDFQDDGEFVGSLSSPPWVVAWDTNSAREALHTVTATAHDAAGNSATASLGIYVDRTPPSVALTSPATNASVSGTVTLTATASDWGGIAGLEFYDGTALVARRYMQPFTATWDTTQVAAGTHTLTVRAWDVAGNLAVSPSVAVVVAGQSSDPTLATFDAVRKVPACATARAVCDSGALLNGRASLGPEPNAPNALGSTCTDGTGGSYHADESLDALKISTLDGTPLAAGKTVRIDAVLWVWGASSDHLDLYSTTNADAPSWTLIGTVNPAASGRQTVSTTFTLTAGALQAIRAMYRYGGAPGPCVPGTFNDVDDLVFAVQ
jgi:hypothetical protein